MTQKTPYLSAAEIAKRWSISTASVRRMILRGDLTYIKIGRSVRVPIASVESYEKDQSYELCSGARAGWAGGADVF